MASSNSALKIILSVSALVMLSSCDKGEKNDAAPAAAPVSAGPLPAYPDWASTMIGKNLSAVYPASTGCKGHLDAISARHSGTPSGVEVMGWAWDTVTKAPVNHVLFTNAASVIIGAGVGGVTRPDVPAALPDVTSQTTGFTGVVGRSEGKVTAIAIVDSNKACVISTMDVSAGA